MQVSDRLVLSMYFALTTLSTVGYGDFYPHSIVEKIFGAFFQIVGVTIFSLVMNAFVDVVMNNSDSRFTNNEKELKKWLNIIKKIRYQPTGEGKDISANLKAEIESHFKHFWEHDRISTILEKKDYFDSVPFTI
jgi:hypothetical protein